MYLNIKYTYIHIHIEYIYTYTYIYRSEPLKYYTLHSYKQNTHRKQMCIYTELKGWFWLIDKTINFIHVLIYIYLIIFLFDIFDNVGFLYMFVIYISMCVCMCVRKITYKKNHTQLFVNYSDSQISHTNAEYVWYKFPLCIYIHVYVQIYLYSFDYSYKST